MIYLIIAILCSASMALGLKVFRDQKGNRFGILLGNYITCVIISFFSLPNRAQVLSGERVTVLFGLFTGVLFIAGLFTLQTCAAVNGAILTATFSKLGILVPLVISIIFMGERPGILQYIAILMVILSFFLIQPKEEGSGSVKPVILLLTLLCAGCSDSCARIFEHIGSRSEDRLFFFFVFLAASVLCYILAMIEKHRTGKKMLPREMAAGIGIGVANYYSSYLLLAALTVLPGYLVYTIFSVGTILTVTAVSIPAFGERLAGWQRIGMAAILAALIILNI